MRSLSTTLPRDFETLHACRKPDHPAMYLQIIWLHYLGTLKPASGKSGPERAFPTIRTKSGVFGSTIAEAALELPSQTWYTNFDPTNSTPPKVPSRPLSPIRPGCGQTFSSASGASASAMSLTAKPYFASSTREIIALEPKGLAGDGVSEEGLLAWWDCGSIG